MPAARRTRRSIDMLLSPEGANRRVAEAGGPTEEVDAEDGQRRAAVPDTARRVFGGREQERYAAADRARELRRAHRIALAARPVVSERVIVHAAVEGIRGRAVE